METEGDEDMPPYWPILRCVIFKAPLCNSPASRPGGVGYSNGRPEGGGAHPLAGTLRDWLNLSWPQAETDSRLPVYHFITPTHFHSVKWLLPLIYAGAFCTEKSLIADGLVKGCYVLTFWPGQKCHSRWRTGRKWHTLMAVMRGNRVGGNWLMKWEELKKFPWYTTEWCTGREWPLNCMTVISAWWRLNIRFQRSNGRRTII